MFISSHRWPILLQETAIVGRNQPSVTAGDSSGSQTSRLNKFCHKLSLNHQQPEQHQQRRDSEKQQPHHHHHHYQQQQQRRSTDGRPPDHSLDGIRSKTVGESDKQQGDSFGGHRKRTTDIDAPHPGIVRPQPLQLSGGNSLRGTVPCDATEDTSNKSARKRCSDGSSKIIVKATSSVGCSVAVSGGVAAEHKHRLIASKIEKRFDSDLRSLLPDGVNRALDEAAVAASAAAAVRGSEVHKIGHPVLPFAWLHRPLINPTVHRDLIRDELLAFNGPFSYPVSRLMSFESLAQPAPVTSLPLAASSHLQQQSMQPLPTGKKLFGCPQCRYLTDRKNNLKRHVLTMHQECDKSLECCGVTFKNKASLRDHVLIFHNNGYMCRYCGRNFCRKALLKRHLTVHSGQKDYVCRQCDYATSHKSNLERHKKVHERLDSTSRDAVGCCRSPDIHVQSSNSSSSDERSCSNDDASSEPGPDVTPREPISCSRIPGCSFRLVDLISKKSNQSHENVNIKVTSSSTNINTSADSSAKTFSSPCVRVNLLTDSSGTSRDMTGDDDDEEDDVDVDDCSSLKSLLSPFNYPDDKSNDSLIDVV